MRRRLPALEGAQKALAAMVVFTSALLGIHIVPGALGLFDALAVLVAALLVAGGALLGGTPSGIRLPGRFEFGWLAGAAACLVAGAAVMSMRDVLGMPVTQIDALSFQLPVPARWVQNESLWGLHQFYPEYSNATYPHHGNLLAAALMLPFESTFLTRAMPVPYWILAGVAVYAVGRELGAPRTTSILAGAAFLAVPILARSALEGVQTDTPMLACLGAGVLFLLRHDRTADRSDLVLAGLALGLSLGTKWYALTTLVVVLGCWGLGRLARRRPLGRPAAMLGATILLGGGFWLLRNLVDAGNPLFPQRLGPLFDAPPDRLREIGGFTIADYATDWPVWREYLIPAFRGGFGLAGAGLAIGWLLATVAALRRTGRVPGSVLLIVIATVGLALAYAVTPYSAFGAEGRPVLTLVNARYGLPAIMAAAAVCAWAIGRAGRLRLPLELLLLAGVVHGLSRGLPFLAEGKLLAGALLAASAWVAWTRLLPTLRVRPTIATGLAAVIALGAIVTVDIARRRANAHGWGQFEPAIAWIESHAPSGARVGIAATWTTEGIAPPLPAFGPRLGNDVRYMGRFSEHLLHAHETRDAFVEDLRDRDLLIVGRSADLLVLTTDATLVPEEGLPQLAEAREERWARSAGWIPVVDSPRLALLRAPDSVSSVDDG